MLFRSQELGTYEESVGTLVLCQEGQCDERVGAETDKQAKRTFRRLKSPTRTRKLLRELNGKGESQMNVGKRKVLIRDEEMEKANHEVVQWKKTKPMEELYSAEVRGEEVGSFLKGAPKGK